MPNGSVSHITLLIDDLKDPEEAIGYLNVLLKEFQHDDTISKKILINGISYIMQAYEIPTSKIIHDKQPRTSTLFGILPYIKN